MIHKISAFGFYSATKLNLKRQGVWRRRTVLKPSILDIWRLSAAICTLCDFISRSDASRATEWACFHTSNSSSSSATRFSRSALRLTVAEERSMKIKLFILVPKIWGNVLMRRVNVSSLFQGESVYSDKDSSATCQSCWFGSPRGWVAIRGKAKMVWLGIQLWRTGMTYWITRSL